MEQTLEKQSEKKQVHHEETPLEFIASICSVLVLGLFALTFIFQNFEIPSASMEKTLLIGDHVVVDRMTLAPPSKWAPFVHYRDVRRGDIIVFFKPVGEPNGDHIFLVKRVVGIPGDRIHLRNGIVYLNGQPQDEPQAAKPGEDGYFPYRDDFPSVSPTQAGDVTAEWAVELPTHIQGDDLVVPPGHYFAMGDNRDKSADSRYWGFVPRDLIVGKGLIIYCSYETDSDEYRRTEVSDRVQQFTDLFTNFFTKTRWSRTLKIIR